MNTQGSVSVPIDQFDALIADLDDLRQRPAIRVARDDDVPVTSGEEAARLFSDLAGHVQLGHGDVWSTTEPEGWFLEVSVPDGVAVDGWDDAVAVLAKHGAEGMFTRQSEYDDEPTRRRISGGKVTAAEAVRVFTGDIIAWIGQMQSIADTTLDHVVTAPTKPAALASLADAARADHTTHAGEVPADALPADGDSEAIVTAWAIAAGVKWTVRPFSVTSEMYPQPPTTDTP